MPGARYDGYADWYDEHRTGFTAEATAHVLDLLVDGTGHCLEVGCGGGVHLPTLHEHGWNVVGLDISADQLCVARTRVPDARLIRADAAALPFADRSFDAVVAVFVHTDLDDLAGAVREAARVLRPGHCATGGSGSRAARESKCQPIAGLRRRGAAILMLATYRREELHRKHPLLPTLRGLAAFQPGQHR